MYILSPRITPVLTLSEPFFEGPHEWWCCGVIVIMVMVVMINDDADGMLKTLPNLLWLYDFVFWM